MQQQSSPQRTSGGRGVFKRGDVPAVAAAVLDELTARITVDSLKLETLKATRRQKTTLATAEDAALRLRSHARGTLGPRNEQLTCFGVAPLKKRRLPRPDDPIILISAKDEEDAA